MAEFYFYSRSHAFRYERKNTNPPLVRIELTTSALAGVQVTYETTRATTTSRLPARPLGRRWFTSTKPPKCVTIKIFMWSLHTHTHRCPPRHPNTISSILHVLCFPFLHFIAPLTCCVAMISTRLRPTSKKHTRSTPGQGVGLKLGKSIITVCVTFREQKALRNKNCANTNNCNCTQFSRVFSQV